MNAIVKPTALVPPVLNDANLAASLERQCGLRLEERRAVKVGQPELIAIPTHSTPNFPSSIALLERALEPAPAERIEAALATLSVLVARRAGDDADAELLLAAYTAQLRQYPADIALRVLTEWPRRSKWWPAWCELEEELQRLVRWRDSALAAVRLSLADQSDDPAVVKDPEGASKLRALAKRLRVSAPRAPQRRAVYAPERTTGEDLSAREAAWSREVERLRSAYANQGDAE